VVVVNTDTPDYKTSNPGYALLQGDAAAGIPTILTINGKDLAPSSWNPSFATNNVETAVMQGSLVKLGGTGFDTTNGVAIDLFCACAGGKVGPFYLNPGNAGLKADSISFTLPARGPNAPLTGPGSFVVINKGADRKFSLKSQAVSVPIGSPISVGSAIQSAGTITVNGTGYSSLTVINFFNSQGAVTVNLGGLQRDGTAKIPLTLVNSDSFTFMVPAGASAGPSYVQALSPPFVPFTSAGKEVTPPTPHFHPNSEADAKPDANAHRDTDGNAEPDTNAHRDPHRNTEPDTNAHRDAHGNGEFHADRHPNRDFDSDAHSKPHTHCNFHSHTDSDVHGDGYADTNRDSH